jgi:hypothetical protein
MAGISARVLPSATLGRERMRTVAALAATHSGRAAQMKATTLAGADRISYQKPLPAAGAGGGGGLHSKTIEFTPQE